MTTTSALVLPAPSTVWLLGTTRRRMIQNSDYSLSTPTTTTTSLFLAKRNRKINGDGGDDDINKWYERVNPNATPDKVFWEEMERQRLLNQIGGDTTNSNNFWNTGTTSSLSSSSNANTLPNNVAASLDMSSPRKPPTMDQLRTADATLSEFTLFQVQNNWLNEQLQSYFQQMDTLDLEEDLSLDEATIRLEEQLEDLPDGYGGSSNGWRREDDAVEPWEYWGEDDKEPIVDLERANVLKVPEPPKGTK